MIVKKFHFHSLIGIEKEIVPVSCYNYLVSENSGGRRENRTLTSCETRF